MPTSFASVSGGDYWAERGEAGRWVRVHTHPRTSTFLPWKVPGGPGRKTRLTRERSTRGVVNSQGQQFRVDDLWDTPTRSILPMTLCTGRTTFLIDKAHTDRWGTDQRRQRIEAANLRESHDMFDEDIYSTKSRWIELSGLTIQAEHTFLFRRDPCGDAALPSPAAPPGNSGN